MIQATFEKSNGRLFEMFAPDNRYVFVSSPDQIKEVDAAPDSVLSLQAAAKQYSMHGFNWSNIRGLEGIGFIRALRTLLTNHVPTIIPDFRVAISHRMKMEIEKFKHSDGTDQVPIYPMIVTLIVLANSLFFFGPELARNEAFMSAALLYIEETLLIAEVVRLTPRLLAPVVASILGKQVRCQAKIYRTLMVVAEERVRELDLGIKTTRHKDRIRWIMETSPKKNPWSAQRVVLESGHCTFRIVDKTLLHASNGRARVGQFDFTRCFRRRVLGLDEEHLRDCRRDSGEDVACEAVLSP